MQDNTNQAYQPLAPPPQPRAAVPPPPPVQPQAPQYPAPQQPAAPIPGGIPAEQFQQPYPANQPQPSQQPAVQQPPAAPQTEAQPQAPATKANKKRKARKELQQAIGHANEILATAQTVFPFTLFPDTITIDRGKLTISHRNFFRVAEVTSIRIEDILNTTANVGPVFGSLKIATRFFGTDKDYEINYLHRSDALKIKQILQGYIIALQKKIDCSVLPTAELAKLLTELGAHGPDS